MPRSWQQELEIIDRTMRAISSIRDPDELVSTYWNGIGDLVPDTAYVSISRRGETPPNYLITRSSRFTQDINPWTHRHLLPRMQGGILGEVAYAEKPVIILDLAERLKPDDPAHFYLHGFDRLVALPQYDNGLGINVSCQLLTENDHLDLAAIPTRHWHAGLFGRGTQNLVLRNQLDSALRELDRELQVVGEIQRSLLPGRIPDIPGVAIAADYTTSARAGGDYYDFFPLPDGAWGVFIADVSGHGTPAAVLMAITHAIAHTQPGTHTPPAALLSHLNAHLSRSYTRVGSFVTAFYGVLDPGARTLTYSAAGHNPPRLARGERVMAIDRASSVPLGIMEGTAFEQATVRLEAGDTLLLYTDGITEAMTPLRADGRRELFGVERLDRVLVESAAAGPAACISRIRSELGRFTENSPATDDRTVIAIRLA